VRQTVLVSLLLAGCGTGLTGLGTETDPQGDGPVFITDVSPWWGPTAGGTLVTITGVDFTGAVTVTFNGVPADAFRESTESLLVTTPSALDQGPIDIEVVAAEGTATLTDGFWYSDTGMPDVGGHDPGDDPTPSGLFGGLVEMSLLQIACPSCFNLTEGLQVTGNAAFHDPSPTSWTAWLPPSGTCALNPAQAGPTSPRYDVGEWVYLESGATSIALRRTMGETGTLYEAQGFTETDYRRNASFDVFVPDGGVYGAFRVTGGMETTEGFSSISPQELLYTDPSAAFAAALPQSGTLLTWAPSGGTGSFLVLVDVYDPNTGAYIAEVGCFGPDNGAMTVPTGMLAQFPAYSLAAVYMVRYRISDAIIPTNGATLQSISQFGVVGTGTLAPW